ncbi:hypothetical protein C6P40_002616 [Pichia californica]|uniref:Protein PBN1 n=1 Tax=Pichia californica TaxID=460514 RepID=A0A9P7BEM8_9ASCO|nr:hypothetical protein C6P40_002616 [[Candida] californica]
MHPGININIAPQDVSSWREYYELSVFTRDFLLGEQLQINVSELSDMVFEKEWWNWSQMNRGLGNDFNNGIKKLLEIFHIEDNLQDYDAIEILLNKKKLTVYLYNYYESGENLSIKIDSQNDKIKHEFAIVTEMSSILETRDLDLQNGETIPCRFLNGIRGSNIDSILQPTMFLHSPSNYVLPYTNFNMHINQIDNAWMHPIINFEIEMDSMYYNTNYNNRGYLPNDIEILNSDKCELHVEIEFSNEFIVDRYEINRLIENNSNKNCIKKLKNISNNGMDLELPSYKVDEWGSFVDIIIDPDCVFNNGNEKEKEKEKILGAFNIPIHLRYPEPGLLSGGMSKLESPWSKIYWKCPLDETGAKGVNGSFYFEPDRFPSDTSLPTVREYFYPPASSVSESDAASELGVFMPRGDGRLRDEVEGMTGFVVASASLLLAAVAIFKN